MIKKLIFFLLIVVSTTLSAQQYHPMPSHDAVWREYHVEYAGSYYCKMFDYQNYMNGDTIILGKSYHKIYKTGVENGCQDDTSHYTFENQYVGAIREDSSKRIYIAGSGGELLMYDFNFDLGDTLPHMYHMQSNYNYVIAAIDSVLVAGAFHKRYEILFNAINDTVHFIEGVGSSDGLFPVYSIYEAYATNLICFMQDSMAAYPDGQPCDLIHLGMDESTLTERVQVYPNPSNGDITIHFSGENDNNIALQVLNPLGSILYEKNISGRQTQQLDLSSLTDGLYFLRIQYHEKALLKKIVIQK